MFYHFKVYHDGDGLWGDCIELSCSSQSEDGTQESLVKNLKEALNLLLDEPNENIISPLPMKDEDIKEKDVVKVMVEPNIALSLCFKHLRKKYNLTQKEVAERMGYKSVWAYQKLERGKYSNLQIKTLGKIKSVFPDIDLNLIFS